jgi:RecA-family ATPase
MSPFRVYDFEPDNDAETEAKFHLTRFRDVLLDTSAAYLVKDLVPSSGLTVVWGPPKCGKSFWTFDLMMHVARDILYRGRRVQQGIVVYVALEGDKGFRRRIEGYKRHHGVTDVPFYLIADRTDLVHDHNTLIADIKKQTPDTPVAVVIDTLNRSLAGSESSDEDMAAYIRAADAIREAFGCAVIIAGSTARGRAGTRR